MMWPLAPTIHPASSGSQGWGQVLGCHLFMPPSPPLPVVAPWCGDVAVSTCDPCEQGWRVLGCHSWCGVHGMAFMSTCPHPCPCPHPHPMSPSPSMSCPCPHPHPHPHPVSSCSQQQVGGAMVAVVALVPVSLHPFPPCKQLLVVAGGGAVVVEVIVIVVVVVADPPHCHPSPPPPCGCHLAWPAL
jgi:hypothetical protein